MFMYSQSKSYAVVPALPMNLTSVKSKDDLTSTDSAVWKALCFHTRWTGGGKDVGTEVADNPNDLMTGYCTADYKALMVEARLGKNALYRSLKKLEKCGYIERIYHGSNLKTEYILHAPKETVITSDLQ